MAGLKKHLQRKKDAEKRSSAKPANGKVVIAPAAPVVKAISMITVPDTDYEIAQTPVTNAQYQQFLKETGLKRAAAKIAFLINPAEKNDPRIDLRWKDGQYPKGTGDYPVSMINRAEAEAYCSWLSKKLGRQFVLPPKEVLTKALRPVPSLSISMDETRKFTNGTYWQPLKAVKAKSDELGAASGDPVEAPTVIDRVGRPVAAVPNADAVGKVEKKNKDGTEVREPPLQRRLLPN